LKDLSAFVIGWHIPGKKLKHQGKMIVDNQRMNVVANEEEIEVEQKIYHLYSYF
jgi:hypothetical protein